MEQAYWLAWYQIPSIGAVTLKRLWHSFGSLSRAWHASTAAIAQVAGIGSKTLQQIEQAKREIDPLQFYAEHLQQNPQLWCPVDPDYAPLLREIPDPPPILYWRGKLTGWQNLPAVAIVGTRQPTHYGRTWAYRLGKVLAEAGFVIVSGLAEGIDAEAHRGCLDAHGQAIAVVGTSLEKVYPPQHRSLYQRLCQQGLVLSEYAYGTVTDKYSFPRRNRIIAGLSRATLVIEAPVKSGALITAHQANEYGREVYALPNSIEVEPARGCLELIAKGANVILGIDELLHSLGSLPLGDRPSLSAPTITDPLQQKIYELFPATGQISIEVIATSLQIPIGQLSALLVEMEIAGLIQNCGGINYQKS